MFDKERRDSFSTVGELHVLLSNWSDDTLVSICVGVLGWFHAEEDNSGPPHWVIVLLTNDMRRLT